jgi:predicted metal-dependent hydrolase
MSDFEIISTTAGLARLRRSGRRTLAISVLPDGTLELAAPRTASHRQILLKVEKRRPWISRQRRLFKEMNPGHPPRRYISGATHRYLGRQYRLKVLRSLPATVALRGALLRVNVMENDELKVRKALEAWYRERARVQFTARLEKWHQWCRARRLPIPRLRLVSMSKRWGSALSDGTIRLNPDLVRAPSICIDYVITHEICHLKHPNHGPAFWRLLDQLCPKWRKLKLRLERMEG